MNLDLNNNFYVHLFILKKNIPNKASSTTIVKIVDNEKTEITDSG